MKETLKNILYDAIVIGIIFCIIYFLIMPIIKGGEEFDAAMRQRIEEAEEDV